MELHAEAPQPQSHVLRVWGPGKCSFEEGFRDPRRSRRAGSASARLSPSAQPAPGRSSKSGSGRELRGLLQRFGFGETGESLLPCYERTRGETRKAGSWTII